MRVYERLYLDAEDVSVGAQHVEDHVAVSNLKQLILLHCSGYLLMYDESFIAQKMSRALHCKINDKESLTAL